jgi:hypothetical protein
MPGCLSCIVAKDSADENVIWVTEVWDSIASHDALLSLPYCEERVTSGQRDRLEFRKDRRLISPAPSHCGRQEECQRFLPESWGVRKLRP